MPYEALKQELRNELSHTPDAFIMLRFDNTLPIQDLVDVLSLGNRVGSKMIIATSKGKVISMVIENNVNPFKINP